MENADLVLHLGGPGTQPFPDLAAALRVARNARAELPEARIELVVQGPVVTQLAGSGPAAAEAGALAAESGTKVTACRNSLRTAGIDETSLPPGIAVVPAAVAHLAQRQFGGAAYIRI
ncbi:DsrE family protein [Arthrobacter sp. Marseille-P9274]|uniref:DsrE family protein n=1 Tax=Arthrobacter sp. Marseille-P9274 TaxID=2866572 RepID=UPI0021C816B0|nr:DsrE family protein [Arthrobacter sp. Marseille-P9274]